MNRAGRRLGRLERRGLCPSALILSALGPSDDEGALLGKSAGPSSSDDRIWWRVGVPSLGVKVPKRRPVATWWRSGGWKLRVVGLVEGLGSSFRLGPGSFLLGLGSVAPQSVSGDHLCLRPCTTTNSLHNVVYPLLDGVKGPPTSCLTLGRCPSFSGGWTATPGPRCRTS